VRRLRGNFLMNLKPETLRKIDEVITHYPVKRSAALPLLHLVQEEQGWISPEAVEWIAAKLELQPINVYELVTFYPMFRQKPAGRRHIKVCRTLSCALVGGFQVCEEFRRQFDCAPGATSADGAVTVEFVECLASCGTGPVVMVDEELHENVDLARAHEIAARIKAETDAVPRSTEPIL
jgi:NADH-quinone oxidoreductase subunit E